MDHHNLRVTIAYPSHVVNEESELSLILGEDVEIEKYKNSENNTFVVASVVSNNDFQIIETSELAILTKKILESVFLNRDVFLSSAIFNIQNQENFAISTLENVATLTANTSNVIVSLENENLKSHIEALQLTRIENEEPPL